MAPAFESRGFAGTLEFFKNAKMRTETAARDAVDAALKLIFDRSQYYVPVSVDGSYGAPPGSLKESGYYSVFGGGGSEVYGIISYGNARVFYAVYVHERIDVYHEPPTQAKFITQAIRDLGSDISATIARKFFFTMEGRA